MVEQEYIDETSERILHYREYIIFRKFNHVDFNWEQWIIIKIALTLSWTKGLAPKWSRRL